MDAGIPQVFEHILICLLAQIKPHKRPKENKKCTLRVQTFRQYREVFEQQKAVLEQRYRGLLEDAIQDAVFLSTRNNELLMENQSLQHRESH